MKEETPEEITPQLIDEVAAEPDPVAEPPLSEEQQPEHEPTPCTEPPEEIPAAERDVEAGQDAAKMERLIAEAERRGYLKARNEMAQAEMNRPQLMENLAVTRARSQPPSQQTDTFASRFLSKLPRCVWD